MLYMSPFLFSPFFLESNTTKSYLYGSATLSRFLAQVGLSHCRLNLLLSERVMQMFQSFAWRNVINQNDLCQQDQDVGRYWNQVNPRSKHIRSRISFAMQPLRKELYNTTGNEK